MSAPVHSPVANSLICPSLLHPTPAPDGQLTRLRIPGGSLTTDQCRILASFSAELGSEFIQVTNRANVQIRGLAGSVTSAQWSQLQLAGLAAPQPEVDHLRNLMASPTAGIDPAQLIDTRPWVKELDHYLGSHEELAGLSPKFSLGLDGGEQVSIRQQPNDVCLSAIQIDPDPEPYFQLRLADTDPTLLIKPEQSTALIAAIAQVYLDLTDPQVDRKPRLKTVVESIGIDEWYERICAYLPFPLIHRSHRLIDRSSTSRHLGVHPQRQPKLAYLGVALPLGRLSNPRLIEIARLADQYGSGSVRLTPWRNLILPDIQDHHVLLVQQELARLGLTTSAASIWGGLIACSGITGCSSAVTDTQADALALAHTLEAQKLTQPFTIHFSGCAKSCAHHGRSDITLIGSGEPGDPGYDLYLGSGQLVASNLQTTEWLPTLTRILAGGEP